MLFMPVATGGDWIGSLTDTPSDDVPHRRGHLAGWSDRHMKEQSADPMFCWAAYQLETPIYAGHPTGLLKFSSQDRGGGTGCRRPVRSSSMFNNDREEMLCGTLLPETDGWRVNLGRLRREASRTFPDSPPLSTR